MIPKSTHYAACQYSFEKRGWEIKKKGNKKEITKFVKLKGGYKKRWLIFITHQSIGEIMENDRSVELFSKYWE